jgi:ferric-dicitrate binding protein FerR (iron transport regulator)
MNDNDELNDSAVLSAVRDSISGLPMPTAPRLEAITARGRTRRRRRLAGVSMAGVAACAVLVVALAGGGGSAGPAPQARPAPSHHATEVQLAAFSVVADPDG